MKVITFKVKEELFEQIKREADKNGLSVSAWIRIFIIDALKKNKQATKKIISK